MEDDYDRVPVDQPAVNTISGMKYSIQFPHDFSSDNVPLPPSVYKKLEPQKQDAPNEYAPLSKSSESATSGGGNRKNKCTTCRKVSLCSFVLLTSVLSMAALAVAVVSIVMGMHQIAECKGQVESLIEEFCDGITGGQNNGTSSGMVMDSWNNIL